MTPGCIDVIHNEIACDKELRDGSCKSGDHNQITTRVCKSFQQHGKFFQAIYFQPIVTGELIRKVKVLHQVINIVFVESKFGLAHVVGQVIEIKMFIVSVW